MKDTLFILYYILHHFLWFFNRDFKKTTEKQKIHICLLGKLFVYPGSAPVKITKTGQYKRPCRLTPQDPAAQSGHVPAGAAGGIRFLR